MGIRGTIAHGACGAVHACATPASVVKQIKLSHCHTELAGERMLRELVEVRVLLTLAFSCHIINLHAWAYHGGTLYLQLERCIRGDLQHLVDNAGGSPLPHDQIKSFTRDITQGINHLHMNGIIHCDIKPGLFIART